MEIKPLKSEQNLSKENNQDSTNTSSSGRKEEVIILNHDNMDTKENESTAERRFHEGLADNTHTEINTTGKSVR